MNVDDALEFVEKRLYARTGKRLNDLERKVLIGSWQGQTYHDIYPHNPEYVEKTVAHRLWEKLSLVFGEKVLKRWLKGVVERAWQARKHVFISYRGQHPDQAIAATLSEALQSLGYQPFVNDLTTTVSPPIHQETNQQAVIAALGRCDCFLLLLSSETAVSEMLIEQLHQLRQEVGCQGNPPPQLVAIWLSPVPAPLISYDLRSYLQGAYHWFWQPDEPTATLQRLKAILEKDAAAMAQYTFDCPTFEAVDAVPGEAPDPLGQGTLADMVQTREAQTTSTSPTVVSYPLPGAEPEIPQGQVRADSNFYVERLPYEAQCFEEIGRSGALIRIKAPRQMGKTSLMARILGQARGRGYKAIPVSFQLADQAIFQDLGSLLRWFCAIVARKLRLPHRLEDYWDDTFGSKGNCTNYFEEYLLSEIESPLVLGLDEVDEVFRYPTIADDFFGLLRAWYEEGGYGDSNDGLWERLRLVVVHSTEVYLPLDVNQSPFNVGMPIELPEFTADQVADLVQRHGLVFNDREITNLMTLVGGHPYLVRLALYHLVQNRLALAELCQTGPTEAGIYGDHLRRRLANLEQNLELAQAYRAILDASIPLPLDSARMFKLHSLGLVKLTGNGAVPSFELYRRYFSDRLQGPSS